MVRYLMATFVLLLLVPAAVAQPKPLGTRVAGLVAPLEADEAIVIVRVDTAKIDFQAGLDWAAKAMKASDEERADLDKLTQEPREFLQAFRAAGGQELVWLIYPKPGAGRDPIEFAALATASAGKAKGVAGFLRQAIPAEQLEVAERGDAVVLGTPLRVKSFDAAAKASPLIAKAFDTAGEGTVQVVLQLSPDMRRVLSETLPRLPDEFGGATGKELSEAFSWAALTLDPPPKPRLKLQIQATSADGARTLARVAGTWPKLAGPLAEIRQAIPAFDDLTPLLIPQAKDDKVLLSLGERPGEIDRLLPILVAPLQAARGAAARSQLMNSFKQIGLAMHIYHDTNKRFPAQAIRSKDGKPLLSWRVAVLPHLDANELYKQFHLDEPWDSEHNKKLIEKMPKVFEDPRVPGLEKGKTTLLVPVGEKTIFADKEGMKLSGIADGTSNTILAVEGDAKHAVIWTKPDDLTIDDKEPARGLFADDRKQVLFLFADGSVRALPLPKLGDNLKAMFTASGGEVVEIP